jgi:serine protease Do
VHSPVPSLGIASLTLSLLVGGAATGRTPQTPSPAPAGHAAVDQAIASVYPSLVRLTVVAAEFSAGREISQEEAGSGTIITAAGDVVTNYHVAGRARRITVTLPDKQDVPAEVVGADPMTDIAVIKLHPATPRTFPAAPFGDSSKLRRGDPVLAMGSPFALAQSVTSGIVSNPEMILPQLFGPAAILQEGEDVGAIVRWIQHDAAIFPGNSGGPLVNMAGEIVGVNELSIGSIFGAGVASAIPANLVKPVVDAIIKDGRVRRSWTGVELQPRVSTITSAGALVSWVADRSPAATAGVKAGDVLARVNGTAVDVQYAEQLPPVNQLLMSLPIGAAAALTVRRGTGEITISVTPVERPPALALPAEVRTLGLVASNLSSFQAREMGRDSAEGVHVLSVHAGGPAQDARPPLAREDVIVAADGVPVATVSDLEKHVAAVLTERSKAELVIAFDRGREHRMTVLEIAAEAPADEPRREASKAWLPVTVQALTPPLAAHLGLRGRTGARVTSVLDPSAPLKVGDVILAIDAEPVRASAPADDDVFAVLLRRYAVGATVTLTVNRAGSDLQIPVTLVASPHVAREMRRYDDPNFDFRVRDIADADRDDPKLAGATAGVIVDSVTQGGWAALGHLADGDVILAIDGQPVADIDGFIGRMKAIAAKRPAAVVLQVQRGVRTSFVELKPDWR